LRHVVVGRLGSADVVVRRAVVVVRTAPVLAAAGLDEVCRGAVLGAMDVLEATDVLGETGALWATGAGALDTLCVLAAGAEVFFWGAGTSAALAARIKAAADAAQHKSFRMDTTLFYKQNWGRR
jgi:hypothetical protein